MQNLARIFREPGLPGYCRALVWTGSLGWGLSSFLALTAIPRFEYRPFQGIVATPAFLLYPEQKEFWLYLLALVIVPLTTIIIYAIGVLFISLCPSNRVYLPTVSSTFLLGWLVPLSYTYRSSVDWVLLLLSFVLFVSINGVICLWRFVDPTRFAVWLFCWSAVNIALLTSSLVDRLPVIKQHPVASSLLFLGLGCMGYLCLMRSHLVQSVVFGMIPLSLLPLHSLLWAAVYQGNREILQQGSTTLALEFDGVLIVASLLIGLASFAVLKKWKGHYGRVLSGCLLYITIPVLLYVLAYNPNIHGPLDFFHEGERLTSGYAIAQGKVPYKEVVFIHGFLRDPGVALAAFKLFGYSVAGVRILEHLLFPAIIVLSYYLALLCLSPEIAILYSLLSLTGFWPFFYDWRMNPPLLVLITLAIFIDKRRWLLSFLAGIGVFLALLTSTDMGILSLVVGCSFFGLFSVFSRKADALAGFLLSFGICLGGAIIWLAKAGVLSECFHWNLHLLRVNTHWNGMPFPYPLDTWARTLKAFLSPAASILSIVYLIAKWFRREWRTRCWFIFVLLIANMVLYHRTIVGGQLYSSHIQDGSHFAPLLLMTILFAERPRFSRHMLFLLLGILLLVPTPLSSGRTLLRLFEMLPEKNRIHISEDWVLSDNPRIGSILMPREQYFLVSELVAFLSSAESFWDFTDHGLLYFLSDHLNPTRFYATHHIITVADQQEVITTLEEAPPLFVLYRSGTGWDSIAGIDRTVRSYLISEYLLNSYHFYKQIGGFVILERGKPDTFPQPLAFRVDLGYMPVLWARDFLSSPPEGLRSEVISSNWQPNPDVYFIEAADSKLCLLTTGRDPWLEQEVFLNPRYVRSFLLRIRAGGDSNLKAQIFWRSDEAGFSEEHSVLFNLIPDGEEHLYLIPLASFPGWAWSDTVTGLRFDPADKPAVEVTLMGWEALRRVP